MLHDVDITPSLFSPPTLPPLYVLKTNIFKLILRSYREVTVSTSRL